MLSASLIEVPRVFMYTLVATDMVTMARGRLNLVMATMAMLQATIIEAHKVFMDIMVTMERDLLMLDTMEVPALMFTRAVPTTTDLMAMESTIMARDLPMLDTMAMDIMVMVVAASSMLTGPTLPMELMLLTPTKREIVHIKDLINKYIQIQT